MTARGGQPPLAAPADAAVPPPVPDLAAFGPGGLAAAARYLAAPAALRALANGDSGRPDPAAVAELRRWRRDPSAAGPWPGLDDGEASRATAALASSRPTRAGWSALARALCAGAGVRRCWRCGRRLALPGEDHRCAPTPPGPLAGQPFGLIDGGPIANDALVALYSRVATALAGAPRRVRFGPPGCGFATDLRGTITIDPEPLPDRPLAEQLAVILAGLYHELGHEEWTPPALWAGALAIRDAPGPVGRDLALGFAGRPDVSVRLDGGRAIVPHLYNVVEDGRMERVSAGRYARVAALLAADAALNPRWDERVGGAAPPGHQLSGALLATALPCHALTPALYLGLAPAARALYDDLGPVVAAAVRSPDPAAALSAALYCAARIEVAGLVGELVGVPPPSAPLPAPGGGVDAGEGGRAQRATGAGHRASPPPAGDAPDGGVADSVPRPPMGTGRELRGPGPGSGPDRPPTSASPSGHAATPAGPGAAPDRAVAAGTDPPPHPDTGGDPDAAAARSPEGGAAGDGAASGDVRGGPPPASLDALLTGLEAEAADAVADLVRRRARPDALAARLWLPLPGGGGTTQYAALPGGARAVAVDLPRDRWGRDPAALEALAARLAPRLARQLAAVLAPRARPARRQARGRLDRSRLVPALVGAADVWRGSRPRPVPALALSALIDQSASMRAHVASGRLCVAALTLARCWEALGQPYELRLFSGGCAQLKGFGDARLDPARAAALTWWGGGGTRLADAAGLAATALGASDDTRLLAVLTDGACDDHLAAAAALRRARRGGILTFGVYFGQPSPPQRQRLGELFGGAGAWVAIGPLDEFPVAVGRRVLALCRRLGAAT